MLLWDVAPCRVSRSRALGKRMKTETQLKICSCSVVATRPGLLWSQVTHGPDRGRGTARSLLLSPLILVVQVPSLCYFSLSLSFRRLLNNVPSYAKRGQESLWAGGGYYKSMKSHISQATGQKLDFFFKKWLKQDWFLTQANYKAGREHGEQVIP
jgi:hypothetical protein